MKSVICYLAVVACVFVLTGCPPFEDFPEHHSAWIIKNSTDRTIVFRDEYNRDVSTYSDYKIFSGDSMTYGRGGYDDAPSFESIFLSDIPANNTTWVELRDADTVLIRRWEFSQKDESGKQFFNESSWVYVSNEHGDGFLMRRGLLKYFLKT